MLNLQSSEHIITPFSFTSNLKKPPVPVNSFTELTAAQTTLTTTRIVDSTSGSGDEKPI